MSTVQETSTAAADAAARATAERILGAGGGSAPRRLARAIGRELRETVSTPGGAFGLAVLAIFTLIAIFAPLIAPQDPTAASSFSDDVLAGPSSAHWLGTDENGRDVLSELLLGTRASMLVGFAAALVSSLIGTFVGVVSGFFGGWTDRTLTLIDDWFLAMPFVPVAVLAATLLGARANDFPLGQNSVLILVIGLFGWAGTSRVVRAEVLSLKRRPFVERARALGASDRWIVRHQILPNVMGLVFANTVIFVALSILTESTLSYLGLGDPDGFSWGQMLASAQEAGAQTAGAWAYFLPPGICITLVVLGFSLVGRTLEQRFEPDRERRS